VVEVYSTPIDNEEHSLLLSIIHDITQRKEAESNLKKALLEAQHLRDALDHVSAYIYMKDLQFRYVYGNRATLELFGVTDEATVLSLAPWSVSPATQPDGRPSADKALEMIKTAMLEGAHAFEWRHQRLDGREIPASVQLTRLEFAGQSLLQATIRDLGPTERALSSLRDSEMRLRLAVEATGIGTYCWDYTTGKADYSPEFLALYGLPPDGALPLGPDLAPLAVLEEDRPAFLADMAAGNEPQGDGVMKADYRIRRPDGSIRWLMAHGRTHFDHWDERLAKMLDGRVQQYCEIILSLACRDAGGIAVATIDLRLSNELHDHRERAEMLRQMLDLLISDGYLVRQEGAVRFRSALLRRYWREVQS